MKQYADRDTEEYANLYLIHVEAMTAERLHDKSRIAAELAFRDLRIVTLEAELAHIKSNIYHTIFKDERELLIDVAHRQNARNSQNHNAYYYRDGVKHMAEVVDVLLGQGRSAAQIRKEILK
jgi:hypothetical protein